MELRELNGKGDSDEFISVLYLVMELHVEVRRLRRVGLCRSRAESRLVDSIWSSFDLIEPNLIFKSS